MSCCKVFVRVRPLIINEAINWAVLEWEVDIITISIALSEKTYDINAELDHALSPKTTGKGKIVFAAAGNRGANKQREWPARKPGVIAIHATDGRGEAPNINPPREGNHNFATLGHDINMRWPCKGEGSKFEDMYISGTSFSTPIAAGMAANVLEFARHRLKLSEWEQPRFYSHNGMRKILAEMAVRQQNGYDYLRPWRLWEEAFEGTWGDKEKLDLFPGDPENICEVLRFIVGFSD